MTEYTPEKVAELIADAREWPRDGVNEGPLINALADALEAVTAHDAEKRAEWEAEVEWEYGNEMLLNTQTVIHPASSEMLAKAQAWLWPMHRRRKAGPWLPAAEDEATDREDGGER